MLVNLLAKLRCSDEHWGPEREQMSLCPAGWAELELRFKPPVFLFIFILLFPERLPPSVWPLVKAEPHKSRPWGRRGFWWEKPGTLM